MHVTRRYHLHYPTLLYAGVTILIGFGAVNSQNNLLYIAFGLALAGLVVSGVVSGWMLMGLRARRVVIGASAVGEPVVVRYEVSNRNRLLPAFAMTITELPDARAGATWPRHIAPAHGFITHLGARKTVSAELVARATRRGEPVFTAFRISSSFPFGIVRKSVTFRQRTAMLVRPEAAAVGPDALRRAASAADIGAAARARVGRGMDYLGVREYVPGDSPRQIAWRATARTGQLIVRENMEPATARVWIALDLDSREGEAVEEANERAISLGAGLIRRAAGEEIDVGLLVPGLGVRRAPGGTMATGPGHALALLDDLARLDLSKLRDDRRGAPGAGGRSAMIVVHAASGREGGAEWPPGATHMTVDAVDASAALRAGGTAVPIPAVALDGATPA